MNDARYVGKFRNGKLGNAAVAFIMMLGFLLAIVSIPLEMFGS